MVWWNPTTWFSRGAAKSMINEANSATLRNALRNYVNAVNKLNNKNNAHIYGLLMKTANGANSSYKNRIVNGVAKIIVASRRALPKAAEAVAGIAPETQAAVAVNNAAAKIKNLNNFMAEFKGGNANALAKYYTNSGRNSKTNRNINSGRNGGARYTSLWNNLNRRVNVAAFAELPGTEAAPPALNEENRQKKINAALAEINEAGNNINKLRGIKTRLNNAKFNRGQASASAITKYDILSNKIEANQALKNADALTSASNQATINSVLKKLRNLQNRVPNTMRPRIANKIANVERQSLLKTPLVTAGETGAKAPLELNINVPGTNTKVKVKRNSPGSNWYFANSANNARYNLNNRNQNVPKVRNVSTGKLFKQGN